MQRFTVDNSIVGDLFRYWSRTGWTTWSLLLFSNSCCVVDDDLVVLLVLLIRFTLLRLTVTNRRLFMTLAFAEQGYSSTLLNLLESGPTH